MMDRKSWIGFVNLYAKEVRRFLNVYNQTLIAPLLHTLIFMLIFSVAMGRHRTQISGLDFKAFIAPGLIAMSMIQNGFANTSSSLVINKVMGSVVDYMTPPFRPSELLVAVSAAGASRAVIIGIGVGAAVSFFAHITIHAFFLLLAYVFLTAMISSMLGLLIGLGSDNFDEMFVYTNYLITPFSFLSGTFFSVLDLPTFWQRVNKANPFFYMVNGIRYGLTGLDEGGVYFGAFLLSVLFLLLFVLLCRLLRNGWGLRS